MYPTTQLGALFKREAALFCFSHFMSSKEVYWLWRLREVFDGQSIRGERLPLENMIEGLITQEPQTCDAFFSTEITDHLFQKN